jgi:hypothetical protein
MSVPKIQIVNIALKSGASILTALTGLKTIQKPDMSGYMDVTWTNVTKDQFSTLKPFHPNLVRMCSVNVAQIEAISIVDEI